MRYNQDIDVIENPQGQNFYVYKKNITPPKGMTVEEFDKKVINTAESFGNQKGITYNVFPKDETEGNCNTSTSTILKKSGVSNETIKSIRDEIDGWSFGFGNYKPWTKVEQKIAIKTKVCNFHKYIQDQIDNGN